MTTYGEAFLDDYSKSIESLKLLAHNPYQPEQVRDILSAVGTKSEIFLKSVLLPTESPKKTFEHFVDAIPATTIGTDDRTAIHALRKLYNKAKHDPFYQVELLDAFEVISNAIHGLERAIWHGLGLSNHVQPPNIRRIYWISVADHYMSGETEVHIHIPGISNHWLGVPSFDHVNIAGTEWDRIKGELASVGKLRNGTGIIPKEQFDAFVADEGSLTPLVFEGFYKNLLTILASHELRLDILPGLRREDNWWSMVVAVMLAACDTASNCIDATTLPLEIQQHVVDQYAIPSNYQGLPSIVEGFSKLICQLPVSDWKRIHGPVWARIDTFTNLEKEVLARHTTLPVIITADHTLVANWDHS